MLSAESLQKIDREVAKYPADQKQSAVMAALAIAQDEQAGWRPRPMDVVAEYLGMPPIAVYEVATFYNMYNLQPVGKYKLKVCTNLPCALQGANEAVAHIRADSSASASTRPPPTACSRCRRANAWAPAATRR